VGQCRYLSGLANSVTLKLGYSSESSNETYLGLSDADFREHPLRRYLTSQLDRMEWSMSLFVLYFGTDIQYPDIAHHEILMGPRYRGLLKDIFDKKKLSADFSLYLHRPTATDPSLAFLFRAWVWPAPWDWPGPCCGR